mgnify:FL=1
MGKFVVDAYSWVEYFNGTKSGEKVKGIVENSSNLIYTNVITIAELSSYFTRKGYDFETSKKIILSLSLFFPITKEFAEEAGKLHARIKKEKKHIGLVDILILLTAIKLNAKVITGDEDFRDFKETLIIK